MTLLNDIFPTCTIVEAGSSSRRTNAMPISDLDIVCGISSNTDADIKTFEEFLVKLISAIKQHHPQWNVKIIFASIAKNWSEMIIGNVPAVIL